ncbi:hypothetical protein PAXRUDRAFT_23393 [Paxillus rubicundulus Ve08.2h10]|uniref:Uncharacterized protein n=1 Tax=Paxillus rubicundulus Ve08.2h10 TaxID=930991 RepID=A0A0D0EAA4_9AGAM|nr:hypothetical protein PAXRUDRAFT_23393 [Paxillus rubicundulus Ve08.2h10]
MNIGPTLGIAQPSPNQIMHSQVTARSSVEFVQYMPGGVYLSDDAATCCTVYPVPSRSHCARQADLFRKLPLWRGERTFGYCWKTNSKQQGTVIRRLWYKRRDQLMDAGITFWLRFATGSGCCVLPLELVAIQQIMSSGGTPAIFNSGPAVKAVITLILIENSQEMVSAWEDLRGHYLPTLLGTMRMSNPVVPIPVLWLTTSPTGDDSTTLHSPPPRQYNQLPELRFNFSPDNRINSRVIDRAIEVEGCTKLMMEATAPLYGGPVSLHLIIVAASPPMEDTWGVSTTMPTQIGQSEWQLLGQKMAQHGIHCHMVLLASQNMKAMIELFETNGHRRVLPWFPTSTDYTFHLSASRADSCAELSGTAFSPVNVLTGPEPFDIPMPEHPPSAAVRPPVHRHQTFPQDPQRSPPDPPAPLQAGSTPSLVSSLQKVHGLSRKKLYSAQSPRQPFVREEPVRQKYRQAPTPLSIPAGGQSFATPEVSQAVGKSKVDRSRRADRASHTGEHASFPASSPATSTTFSSSMIPEGSFSAVMTPMCDASGGYFPASPPLPTPLSAVLPVPSQGPAWTPVAKTINSSPGMTSGGLQSTLRRHSLELQHGASLQNLNAMSNKYRLDSVPHESRNGFKVSQKVKDAGDVPFIFSPELEAATAAKLKAALQSSSTTSQFSAFTSMDHHMPTDGTSCASDLVGTQVVL